MSYIGPDMCDSAMTTVEWERIEMTFEAAIGWERTMLFSLLTKTSSSTLKDICRGALSVLREVEVFVVNNDSVGSEQIAFPNLLLQGAINSRKAVEFALNETAVDAADVVLNSHLKKPLPCIGNPLNRAQTKSYQRLDSTHLLLQKEGALPFRRP